LELIVALTIFTMIGTALLRIFISGVQFYSQEQSQLENQQNLTVLSAFIEADLRQTRSMSLTGTCLSLSTTQGTVLYCHDAAQSTLTRNGQAIAQRIASVTFSIEAIRLRVTLTTVADRRGITNTMIQDYILREGNF
jgi:type II secretory pathway pseudopilin PulG